MRVLCAGDLHIGRRSSRLPADASESISAASAWARIVEYAVSQKVDVVALSGDVVDQDNRFYESIGPLERGLRQLGDAGIRTVAVAGNHDFSVLPELVSSLPSEYLQLLGAGGMWERTTITASDRTKLHIDGWSFSRQHVNGNPLASYNLPAASDAPVLGLLHGDLDQPASRYAPLSLSDLQARPVAMWLLGHVHVPSLRSVAGKPPVLYPGSPQPLDPGESGSHGVWLVDFTPGTPVVPQQMPIASARYESLEVDITGVSDQGRVRVLMLGRIRGTAEAFASDNAGLQYLSLRLRLTGRSPLREQLAEDASMASDLDFHVGAVRVCVEQLVVETRPDRDLAALEVGGDAAAYLAKLLLALEQGNELPEHRNLLDAVKAVPKVLAAAKPYRTLKSEPAQPGEAALRAQLADVAGELLDELLAQKEGAA